MYLPNFILFVHNTHVTTALLLFNIHKKIIRTRSN